jgi:hypothetical protein
VEVGFSYQYLSARLLLSLFCLLLDLRRLLLKNDLNVPRKSRLKPWFADFVVMNFHNRPPLSIEALKAKKDELERKIVYEVDQIRRLELKEELKKVKNAMELESQVQ